MRDDPTTFARHVTIGGSTSSAPCHLRDIRLAEPTTITLSDDEWTVRAETFSKDISQEALLILDDVTAPDGSAAMHGYTVVITLEKTEFEKLQPLVREILASVQFDESLKPTVDAGPRPGP